MEEEPPEEWGEALGWGRTRASVSPGRAAPTSLRPHPQDQQNQCRQRGTGSGLSAAAPSPAPGRTARGKKLFRYFSTFLTYLVKAADALIRIMSNVGASEHCAARLGGGRAAGAPCADPRGAAGACAPQNPRTPAHPCTTTC